MLLTTVKHALSVSLYEGIIFLSYFKEKRIKKCQRKDVEESVDKIIANRMSKAYSEWKSNQDTQSFNENIEKEYQKLLETLSPEQEKQAMNTDKIYAEQLANEYAPKDTSKVVALRKLDAKAKLPANVFTYTFGIITALVAGVGMCLSMKVIGNGSTAMFVLGVIVGIIGLLGMGVNYPIYKKLLAQGKQKYAFEIMELAKEISEK